MKKLYQFTGAIPFFVAVFLNAFVDLGHKIVIQNTVFKAYDGTAQVALIAVVNGLILLPFILLFSPAGFVSDKYPKSSVMRASAIGSVVLTCMITLFYYLGYFWAAFAMTFLMAVQSAFYSPAKYGYIKSLFGKNRLPEGNGAVQSISIVAILAGTVAYSSVFELWYPGDNATTEEIVQAIAPLGWLLIANAMLEVFMMYKVPRIEAPFPEETFSMKEYLTGRSAIRNLDPIRKREVIRLSIIGLAMFWSVGQVMLAVFPAFAKETLNITNTLAIQGIIAASGIGIAFGSFIAGKISRNHIEMGLIPVGAAGIGLGLWLTPNLASAGAHAVNYLFIGTMGGLFIVPLNSLIQFNAGEHELGKVLAGNNLIQNIGMLTFLIITALAASAGFKSIYMLYLIAIVAVAGGVFTVYKLPQSLLRIVVGMLLSSRYRIRAQGMKNIPSKGGVLLLGNHISWIDWAIVQLACPRSIRFVMLASIYERWYLKWFLKLAGCVPIAQGKSSGDSLAVVAELLNQGHVVCLFPEGAISRTGHLGTFRSGFERACANVNDSVVIQPFYLRGLWGSHWSRSSERLKKSSANGIQRDLVVAFGETLSKDATADVVKQRVFDLSIQSWQLYAESLPSIGDAFIDSCKQANNPFAIVETGSDPINSRQLLAATLPFAKRIAALPEQNIGLLMPTSVASAIVNMGTMLAGKTIVNLNYSASADVISSAIQQAEIETVFTSKMFLQRLEKRGHSLDDAFKSCRVVFLEEVKADISRAELARYWLTTFLPTPILKRIFCRNHDAESTAAILFSSGSEGQPKGIMLSHRNIMANLKQIKDVLNTEDSDVVMASLPYFHAFGLTVTLFMPLIEGIPVACHPDPTDALGISKTLAKYRATLLCGTSTFLRLFVRDKKVHPLMLSSLRLVIAGAEKLRSDVRDQFKLKFQRDILEGYGATETTPVASVNLPDALDMNWWQVQKGGKPGTVGMALPGSSFKIVEPDTFSEIPAGEAGLILIGGAQVMQGYLNAPEKTAAVIHHSNNTRWYITGDKGYLDNDGFLTIVDRYSRFAKIGGEMVSLGQVEEDVRAAADDDEFDVVAVSLPDEKKGEQIAVLCEQELDTKAFAEKLKGRGVSPLAIPNRWIVVPELPKLGSGKTDFSAAKKLALSLIADTQKSINAV
ncbi:acyl-[ACP]--phospholipid O-acyltransferase [Aurantivibrio plasticivorans]